MRAYHLHATGLDSLQLVDVPEPMHGPDDILIEMKAWSLNYRDLSMPHGGYARNNKSKKHPPLIPLSDGAGEVIAVGDRVTEFKPGDQVASCFFQDWIDGEVTERQMFSALGGGVDGVLAERVVLHQKGAVKVPEHLRHEQAACLPCAALTAWQALTLNGLKAGDTVLLLGTGGVSIFALQFVKMFGGRAMITSSSDDKLARARQLGADALINYQAIPEWDREVRALTEDIGVDQVIEVGGAGTLERSLRAVRVSGTVSLIGILTGPAAEANPSPLPVLFNRIRLQGIYVGSRQMFQDMNRAVAVNRLEPVIDQAFDFTEARAAYEYLQSGRHFGKVTIVRN